MRPNANRRPSRIVQFFFIVNASASSTLAFALPMTSFRINPTAAFVAFVFDSISVMPVLLLAAFVSSPTQRIGASPSPYTHLIVVTCGDCIYCIDCKFARRAIGFQFVFTLTGQGNSIGRTSSEYHLRRIFATPFSCGDISIAKRLFCWALEAVCILQTLPADGPFIEDKVLRWCTDGSRFRCCG